MARITVEDCLLNETNRFALVRLASKRAKQLLLGKHPVTDTRGNKAIVSALREIAAGKVKFTPAPERSEMDDGFDDDDFSALDGTESVSARESVSSLS